MRGYRYFITTTTTQYRYTHVQVLKITVKAFQFRYGFIAWIDRDSKDSVKRVPSDNAKEFLITSSFLMSMDIKPALTSAHTPQSGEVAERMNRTLLEKTHAAIKEGVMPLQ